VKLFLLKRTDEAPGGEWDCNNGFVVRAETTEKARWLCSLNPGEEGPKTWVNPEYSTCEEILPTGEEGIILEDFRSG
jgi:hypothetical protein